MKKAISFLLVFVLCISFCLGGCANGKEKTPPETTQQAGQNNGDPEMGAILSRLTESPVTVEIGQTGVEIDLDYLAWPTITKGEDRTLYAGASLRRSHVDPFGVTAFFESNDGGVTWSEPRIIHDSPVDDRDVGLLYIGDGKMIATFFTIGYDSFLSGGTYEDRWGNCTPEQQQAKLAQWDTYTTEQLAEFSGRFVMLSEDYGKTWGEPIQVPFSSPHGPALMNDGKTLICSGIQSGKTFSTHISHDYGETWTMQSQKVLELPMENYGCYEPHVIQLSDGSFLAGIRAETGSGGSNLSTWIMKSEDGINWTEPKKVPAVVGAPPHLVELSNGVIVMTYSYRIGRGGIRGCVSYDGGVTWTTKEIVISNNTSRNNGDLGYPATVELEDGSLYTIFYQAYGNDAVTSILYTKWQLEPEEQTEEVRRPTALTHKLLERGKILSHLTESPVTVEIGETGVTVDLDYLAWPTITKGEDGTLYAGASLRRGHVDPFGVTAFFESNDGGATWSEPRIIHDSPVDDRDVGLLYIGEGKMIATFFTIGYDQFLPGGAYEERWGDCTEEQKQAKLDQWDTYITGDLKKFSGRFVMVTEDYGKTWSDPIAVPFSSPHGPSLMNDGKTLICSGIQSGNIFGTYISQDYGKTWKLESEVELNLPLEKYGCYEPHVIQLSDGSFLAGIRVELSSSARDLSVWTMKSQDGKNWTEPEKIPEVVGAPPHFVELANGVVVMTYSFRIGQGSVRGCLSYDGGETWSEKQIVLSNNFSNKNRDLGYPATVEMDDGSLITVFYQPYMDDAPTSILYTKWQLEPED